MEHYFDRNDILNFGQRYRTAFVNSLGGFKSLGLVGTRSATGQTNLAIFNSFFHLGANPPLFGFIIRPDSVERHTLDNILETQVFTINHIHEGIYKLAHQTAARYPRIQSEFDATGLTEFYDKDFQAPFVKESTIRIAAHYEESKRIGHNGTILLIASIQGVMLPEGCIQSDGFIDLEKAGTLTGSGLDAYCRTERIARLSYAKPDSVPHKLSETE